MSGGAFYQESSVIEFSREKLIALKSLYEELQGKSLLIAYNFKHELARILKIFSKEKVCVVKGGTKHKDLISIKDNWNAGNIPILLVQPQAMSYGLNLQKGGYNICWFSPPEDLDVYYQLNKRLDRVGQKNLVSIYHLVSKKTLDIGIFNTLRKKENIQEYLKKELYV